MSLAPWFWLFVPFSNFVTLLVVMFRILRLSLNLKMLSVGSTNIELSLKNVVFALMVSLYHGSTHSVIMPISFGPSVLQTDFAHPSLNRSILKL
jgi:hypothetical protein